MIGGLRVLAVVPARGGSKGLPGKNVLPVGGRPLIAWTVEAARRARHVDRVVVSSDDAAIIATAVNAGADAPFVRPAALATDEASSIDVVLHALDALPGYDIVVLLQPTSPLRSAADIDGALERMLATSAPACVTLRPAEEHPWWTFALDASGRLAHFGAPPDPLPTLRQALPPAWCLNGAVYAAHTVWLRRERSFLSPLTVGQPMPADRSVDIDTQSDLDQVEALMRAARRSADDSLPDKVTP